MRKFNVKSPRGGGRSKPGGGGRGFSKGGRSGAGEGRGSGGSRGGSGEGRGFGGGARRDERGGGRSFRGGGERSGGFGRGGGSSRGGDESRGAGSSRGGGERKGGFGRGGEGRGGSSRGAGFRGGSRGGRSERVSAPRGDGLGGPYAQTGRFVPGQGAGRSVSEFSRGEHGAGSFDSAQSERRAAQGRRQSAPFDSAQGERQVPVGNREVEGSERFIFGINPVLEALRARPERIERLSIADGTLNPRIAGELLSRAGDARIRVEKLERSRLDKLAGGGVHQGVVAEVRDFDYLELQPLIEKAKAASSTPLLVVLDGIQDPHNLGAVIRSAHAFGAQGVVLAKDRAAGITGIVAKASAGAVEHTLVARVTNLSRALEQLKEAGYWSVAADPGGDRSLWESKLDGPLVVVVGAEGEGVRPGVLSHCDFKVRIPMEGKVASLNASVSAGVLLYEVARQRGLGR